MPVIQISATVSVYYQKAKWHSTLLKIFFPFSISYKNLLDIAAFSASLSFVIPFIFRIWLIRIPASLHKILSMLQPLFFRIGFYYLLFSFILMKHELFCLFARTYLIYEWTYLSRPHLMLRYKYFTVYDTILLFQPWATTLFLWGGTLCVSYPIILILFQT